MALEIGSRWYSAHRFYELAPMTASLRLLAPIALVLASRGHQTAAAWSIRLAAVATFAGHGIEAIQEHPDFIDYLIMAGRRIGLEIPQDAAADTLLAIGIVDLIAAGLLLARPTRPVLYYMIAWGSITALARVVHSGWFGVTEGLARIIHSTGPLAVLLHRHHWRSIRGVLGPVWSDRNDPLADERRSTRPPPG